MTTWQDVHEALREIARRRAALDTEEIGWLREARRLEVWKQVGCATLFEYLERKLGYAPRTVRDRVRVAEALVELPQLSAALSEGQLSFCAVRELVRVADPQNEAAWIEDAVGRTVGEIQECVAGRKRGDRPTDRPDPSLDRHRVGFEVRPETLAGLREARHVLEQEHGGPLDDDALMSMFVRAILAPVAPSDDAEAPGGSRPLHQIATMVCEECQRGWRDAGGMNVELPRAAVERACCDADWIGSVDAETPARLTSDITPATRRQVQARDRHRCSVPGCRHWRFMDLHHIVRRADGGGHDPSNVAQLCESHHTRVHEGNLVIEWTAEGVIFLQRDGRPYAVHGRPMGHATAIGAAPGRPMGHAAGPATTPTAPP